MFPVDFRRMNRRVFLKISALWSTAAALSAPPVPAKAAPKARAGEFDAVVIGSGLGGLSFAGYMAKHGYKCLILEQHDVPGGYATNFTRDGGRFTFDVSLHQIALSGVTKTILKDLGVLDKVKFFRGHNLARVVFDDFDVTYPAADPKKFEEILAKRYPDEQEGIHGFIQDMVLLNMETAKFFKEGRPGLIGKLLFPIRFPLMWAARKKSLADYLNEYVSNPQLKSILAVFCGYHGLPPDKLSGFYYMNATGGYLRYGGSYPQGGSQAISNALVDFIEAGGGEVKFGVTAEKVLVEENRAKGVKTSDGKVFRAPVVVANGTAVGLFNKMIPADQIPSEYLRRIRSFKPSVSSFIVWLALNKDITDRIKNSHIFLRTESDPDKAFQDALEARAEKVNIGICVYNNIYRAYSPPGTTILSLIFASGYDPWKPFEADYRHGDKKEYHAKKNETMDVLIRRVEEKLIPGLSDMIAVKVAATPLTNIHYTRNTQGAIYGFEQSLNNSYMNRISNRTPIKGLYLASAWGAPGGGYTGVLISGKETFGMVMEDLGKD